MGILQTIKNLDTELLLFINSHHSDFFDQFMYLFSDKFVWIAFYVAVIITVFIRNKKNAIWLILLLVACIVLADQISSSVIKDLVQRLRPSQEADLAPFLHIVNKYTGGLYGFVSSHAANTFGFALLSSLIFQNKLYSWSVFIWAGINSYSRIYLGVHYPSDILGGIIVGLSVASILMLLIKKYKPQLLQSESSKTDTITEHYLPTTILGITMAGLCIYSAF